MSMTIIGQSTTISDTINVTLIVMLCNIIIIHHRYFNLLFHVLKVIYFWSLRDSCNKIHIPMCWLLTLRLRLLRMKLFGIQRHICFVVFLILCFSSYWGIRIELRIICACFLSLILWILLDFTCRLFFKATTAIRSNYRIPFAVTVVFDFPA